MNVQKTKAASPLDALRKTLSNGGASTQEELRTELLKMGFEVTQSTVSRCLRKLKAVKTFNQDGEGTYQLANDLAPRPPQETSLAELVASIVHNDTLIVMKTTPGSASLVALHLDHFKPGGILGTLAGDDTIFIAPPSKTPLTKVIRQIEESISETR